MSKAKLAALAIGAFYAAAPLPLDVSYEDAWWYLVAAAVAECLILFPDQLGSVTGVPTAYGMKTVDTETPGCMVALFGWLVLLGIPLIYWGT